MMDVSAVFAPAVLVLALRVGEREAKKLLGDPSPAAPERRGGVEAAPWL